MVSGGSESADSEQMSEGSGFNTGGNVSGGINLGQNTSEGINIGSGGSSSSNESSSSSNQGIWGPQQGYLTDKYSNAQDMFNQQQPRLDAETDYASNFARQAQNTAMQGWKNQMSGGAINSYTDDMKNSIARDAQNSQNQMLGTMDARAAASGMSGGARHGQSIGRGMTGINDAMMREQANIGFQAEEAQRGKQMQALGMSPQMAQMANAGFDPLNNQWSGLKNYSDMIGDPTVLSNSQSNNKATSDSWNNSFGANQSQGQNLGFNFGLGQTYGENANMSEGDSSSSGWNAGFMS